MKRKRRAGSPPTLGIFRNSEYPPKIPSSWVSGLCYRTNGLVFPDLNADGELTQTNLIMPEPTIFLNRKFPICSIIRPTETDGAAARAINGFIADGLFIGQPPAFFALLSQLIEAADHARHGGR